MSSAETNTEIERNRNAYPEIPVYFFKVLTYCDYVFTTIFAFEVVVKVSVLVVDCTITRNADVGVTWVWRAWIWRDLCLCVCPIELVGILSSYLMSVKKSKKSPQNGGFIRATELAPRLFVGKAKPVFS